MKIEKLKPGMTVYSVSRQKMGNTTLSTVCVWPVRVVSVDLENMTVEASWNSNKPRSFSRAIWSKWREKPPLLIRTGLGAHRLATREEIVAAKVAPLATVK